MSEVREKSLEMKKPAEALKPIVPKKEPEDAPKPSEPKKPDEFESELLMSDEGESEETTVVSESSEANSNFENSGDIRMEE